MTEERSLTVAGRDLTATTIVTGASLIALFAAPFFFRDFFVTLLIQSLILAVFAISVDMLWGYAGILTFGHAAFFGFGAYISAKLLLAVDFAGMTYLALAASVVIPGIAGLLIAGALFYRRIDEEYFTIITLAIAIIAQQVAVSWQSVTNGYNGISGIPPIKIGIPFVAMLPAEDYLLYYVVLAITLVMYLVSRRIIRSPFGSTLSAIDQNEAKARSLGYDTRKYKTLIFAIASAVAGLAGAVYAGYGSFVSPPLLGFLFSTEVLIWVLVGGRGTLVGAIVGTLFINLVENTLSGAFQFSWTLLLGVLLVIIVLAFPAGIVGLLTLARDRYLRSGETG